MAIETFTIIGGGSAYAPGLIAALVHHAPRLSLTEVRLHDIHSEHLEIVRALGARLAERAPFRITATTDLIEAVRGAGAVLNSARPGGFACRRLDETLPLELDIPGQETVGPGGLFFALRSVPEALRLADAMASHAPEAVLLNYTNPTNIVTQALSERGNVQVLGLCDQSDEDLHTLARALGHDPATARFRCVGLNHATWYSEIAFGGSPFARAPGPLEAPADLDEEHRIRFHLSEELAAEHPGFWPNSYLPYYMRPERFVGHSRRSGPRTDAILAGMDDYYRHFRDEAAKPEPVLRHHRGSEGFGDLAVRTLVALGSNTPQELVLNVVNVDITPHFDSGTVVESRVSLSASGVERTAAPNLPDGAPVLLSRLEHYQRLAARAATTGKLPLVLEALTANPLVGDETRAKRLLERACVAYGDRMSLKS